MRAGAVLGGALSALLAWGAPETAEAGARSALEETRLFVDEGGVHVAEPALDGAPTASELPPGWRGEEGLRTPAWVREGLARNRRFVQPLAFSRVQKSLEARISQAGGWNPGREAAELDQLLRVSLWYVEIEAPLLTMREDAALFAQRYRLELKLPWQIDAHHVLGAQVGVNLSTQGATLAEDAGYRSALAYAFGSTFFSAQARLGLGEDLLLGDLRTPERAAFFYELSLAALLGRFQLILQGDGLRALGASENEVRLWPGLRFFPLQEQTLSLGLGAQLWWQERAQEWSMRRGALFVDLGWLFF